MLQDELMEFDDSDHADDQVDANWGAFKAVTTPSLHFLRLERSRAAWVAGMVLWVVLTGWGWACSEAARRWLVVGWEAGADLSWVERTGVSLLALSYAPAPDVAALVLLAAWSALTIAVLPALVVHAYHRTRVARVCEAMAQGTYDKFNNRMLSEMLSRRDGLSFTQPTRGDGR